MDQNFVPFEKKIISLEEVVGVLRDDLAGPGPSLFAGTPAAVFPVCALVDVQGAEAHVFTAKVNIDRTTLFLEEPAVRVDRNYVGTFLVPFGRGVIDLLGRVGFDLMDREESYDHPGHGHLTFVRRPALAARSGFTSGGSNTVGGSAGGSQGLQ